MTHDMYPIAQTQIGYSQASAHYNLANTCPFAGGKPRKLVAVYAMSIPDAQAFIYAQIANVSYEEFPRAHSEVNLLANGYTSLDGDFIVIDNAANLEDGMQIIVFWEFEFPSEEDE